MSNRNHANKGKEKIKYIDQEYDDDDNDSLGSALSDYNGIFYGLRNFSFLPFLLNKINFYFSLKKQMHQVYQ